MATVSITKSAAPTTPQAIPKPKGVRLTCDEVTHPWFSYLAASRYNSSSDAASDINIQETIVATGKYQNKLFDSAELTRGTAYWWRIYWVDIYGNESIKATAVSITYRGAASDDLEEDAATPSKVKYIDRSNMVRDPDCEETSLFTAAGGSMTSIVLGSATLTESANYLYVAAATGEITINTKANKANSFPVKAGKKYYASLTLGKRDTGTATYAAYVLWYSMDNTGALTLLGNSLLGTHSTNQTTQEAIVTAPANARRAVLIGYKNAGINGDIVWYGPIFRKAASTDQIPDGDVTDDKADQTAPGTPTGLAVAQTAKTVDNGDGRVEIGLKATWTAPASGVAVRRYKVEISDGTDTWYDTTKASSYKFWGVVSKTYTVKVNAESFSGVEGSQTSGVALAPSANTVAGSVPTWESGTQIVAKPKGNMLRFVMPADKDFDQVSIWRNTVNNSGTATEIGRTRSNRYKDDENLIAGQAYFYFLKGINRSAVLTSSFSAASSITARGTQSDDIEPLAVIPSKINIGDPSNMVFDGDMTDLTEWLTDGTGLALIGTGLVAEASNRLITTASTSVIGMRQVRSMQVKAGKKYYASAYFGVHSGAESTTFNLYVQWFSMDSSGVETFLSNSLVATYTGTGQTTGTAIVTAPANARRAWFLLVKTATTAAVAPTLGAPVFRKAVEDDLLDSTAPGTPTSLALTQVAKNTDAGDGTVEIALRATWTAPVGGVAVKRYILEISDGTDTWYRYSRQSSEKFPFVVGKNCTINVRAESFAGVEGSPTSNVVKTDVGGKTTAPGSPTSVSITVGGKQNRIGWTAPSDKDILGYNVYFHTANVVGSATLVASKVLTNFFVDATDRNDGTACYYWVAAVNRSLVEGTKVAASNNPQTSRAVIDSDIQRSALMPSAFLYNDPSNQIPNPNLDDVNSWIATITGGALSAFATETNTYSDGYLGSKNRLRVTPGAGATKVTLSTGPVIPVLLNSTFKVAAYFGSATNVGSLTKTITCRYYRRNSDGSLTEMITDTHTTTGTAVEQYVIDTVASGNLTISMMAIELSVTTSVPCLFASILLQRRTADTAATYDPVATGSFGTTERTLASADIYVAPDAKAMIINGSFRNVAGATKDATIALKYNGTTKATKPAASIRDNEYTEITVFFDNPPVAGPGTVELTYTGAATGNNCDDMRVQAIVIS